jgi:tetratricopeptide (TPR) repeat protein
MFGSVAPTVIDRTGFEPEPGERLSVLDSNGRLLLCRRDALSVYTQKGKTDEQIELDLAPTMITWYRQYLVAACRSESVSLKIYDVATHRVFGTLKPGPAVKFFLPEWGRLNILLTDGKFVGFAEEDTEKKILSLCQWGAPDIALRLAESQNLSKSVIAKIHHNKGDTYYEQRDYGEAMREYIEAIGYLEPSYVIKRFLDPQHAHVLINYLEALEDSDVVTRESTQKLLTNLLFNCYTKLRRTDAIRRRITETVEAGRAPHFDVETAVEVLNRGGYSEEATVLAKTFGKHVKYLDLLSDAGQCQEIADYLPRLPASLAASAVLKYGSFLLDRLGEDGRIKFALFVVGLSTSGGADPAQFRTVFALHQRVYFVFLRQLADSNPEKLEQSLWDDYVVCAITTSLKDLPGIMANPAAKYSSEQALIVLRDAWLNLTANRDAEGLQFLKLGLRSVYERRGMYYEIVQTADTNELVALCVAYSEKFLPIWRESLKRAVALKDAEVVQAVVDAIMERGIMTLNEALGYLRPTVCTFVMVQKWAVRGLQELAEAVAVREQQLQEIDTELEANESKIAQLENEYFQVRPGTVCSSASCRLKLDSPCRFFMCGHSFHTRCLGDEAESCPSCRERHLRHARARLDAVKKAKVGVDVGQLLSDARNPLETLANLLKDAYLAPEAGQAGEDEINDFIKKLSEVGGA